MHIFTKMDGKDFNIDAENSELIEKLERIENSMLSLPNLDKVAKMMSTAFISICKDFYLGKEKSNVRSFEDLFA